MLKNHVDLGNIFEKFNQNVIKNGKSYFFCLFQSKIFNNIAQFKNLKKKQTKRF